MKSIILVEDEEMIREMYTLALTGAGYEVDPIEDGETALARLTDPARHYDLMLLDVMLPKLDGISVLKELNKFPNITKPPVFLLTNLGLEDLVSEAMSLGATKYLVKSNILPAQIIEEINTLFQTPEPTPPTS